MDKSDPGVFGSGVAALDKLGTPRSTSGTVVGTPAGYRIGFLPTTSTVVGTPAGYRIGFIPTTSTVVGTPAGYRIGFLPTTSTA
jgi:hypothetical protein